MIEGVAALLPALLIQQDRGPGVSISALDQPREAKFSVSAVEVS
jgi:hypothetical protein